VAQADRAIQPTDFLVRAGNLGDRLQRSLDDWDEGDPSAMEDVAGLSRTALAFGKGDRVVARLGSMFNIDYPSIETSPTPDVGRDVQFALENVPVDPAEGESAHLEIQEWLRRPAVTSASASRRITAWHQLLTDYGNTYGAHVSSTVPEVLDAIDLWGGPNGTLGSYALRSAAVIAERMLSVGVAAAGGSTSARSDRTVMVNNVNILSVAIGGDPSAPWHGFGFVVHTTESVRVLSIPFHGRRLNVDWSWSPTTKGSMSTSLV
jgi:hypothetical protein